MYCELCLLYCIFCAVLYSVKNYLSPALCVVHYVAILCASRIIHFLYCIARASHTANIGGCASKLCTVVVSPILCLQPIVLCVLVLYCISTIASPVYHVC